jgi:hypothetical protein
MKSEEITKGAYYILKDYSKAPRWVYEVNNIWAWFSVDNKRIVRHVWYNYYDSHGDRIGEGNMELETFADCMAMRVKPK